MTEKRWHYTEGEQSCKEGHDQEKEITSGKNMKETPPLGKLRGPTSPQLPTFTFIASPLRLKSLVLEYRRFFVFLCFFFLQKVALLTTTEERKPAPDSRADAATALPSGSGLRRGSHPLVPLSPRSCTPAVPSPSPHLSRPGPDLLPARPQIGAAALPSAASRPPLPALRALPAAATQSAYGWRAALGDPVGRYAIGVA